MNNVRTAGWVIGCAVAVTLGACHSAPTRIYTLDAAVPATRIDTYQAPALRVDTLNVPASWDRIEILSLSAAGTLQISDFDHWSAPLAQMARQTLSDDLDQRLPSGSVIYPRLPKPNAVRWASTSISWNSPSLPRKPRCGRVGSLFPLRDAQGAKRSVASLQVSMTSDGPGSSCPCLERIDRPVG